MGGGGGLRRERERVEMYSTCTGKSESSRESRVEEESVESVESIQSSQSSESVVVVRAIREPATLLTPRHPHSGLLQIRD